MPTAGPRDLKSFLDLARHKTVQSRQQLFENVTDLFISESGRLSERERAQITVILDGLIRDVEKQVRLGLAERLQERTDVPAELVRLLAKDEIDIARPILTRSPLLRDPDLIEIIRLRDQEHWLAITLRQSLSEAVSDAIVATQDVDVIRSLLQNRDARLSQSAMAYLVAEAERVDRLQNPLVMRHDLPPELSLRMYWWVSAALRRHIVRSVALDQATALTVDELIEETAQDAAHADAQRPSLADAARDLIEGLAAPHGITPELLMPMLRHGRIAAVVAGVARGCRLDERLVRRLVLSPDHESVAILCKEMGFTRDDFASFFLLLSAASRRRGVVPTDEIAAILRFYDEITKDIAAAILRHWRRNSDYAAAIERLDID